jgi:protein TonB
MCIIAHNCFAQDSLNNHPPKKLYNPLPLMPQFKGGRDSMNAFIRKNTKYPCRARKHNISGIVQVDFRVTKEGKTTQIHVYKSIGYGCDEEAIRVVKRMPLWKPAMMGREAIDMDYKVDIPFGTRWKNDSHVGIPVSY